MKPEELPQRWKDKIADYLASEGYERSVLYAGDFTWHVQLDFEDRSHANFLYAFVIDAPELDEIVVCTEHCGYHIFYRHGLKWNCAAPI